MLSLRSILLLCFAAILVAPVVYSQEQAPPGGAQTSKDLRNILIPDPGPSAPPGIFTSRIVNDQLLEITSSHVDHNGWHLSLNLSNNRKYVLLQFPCIELPKDPTDRMKALEAFLKENTTMGYMRFEIYEGSDMVYMTYPIANEHLTTKSLNEAVEQMFSTAKMHQSVWNLAFLNESPETKETPADMPAASTPATPTKETTQPSVLVGMTRLNTKLEQGTVMAMVSGSPGSGLFGLVSFSPKTPGKFSWQITTAEGTVKSQGTYVLDSFLVLKHDQGPASAQKFEFEAYNDKTQTLVLKHASGMELEFKLK